ncbi:RNA polymerase sigma factor [Novosphingobium terrae]|uniref:RNA polymerase sigma factor n=1 Tax=Novosphingobium terrae TaxID=2726189 RepID=UPI001981E2F9|nr:RNA polymerase sigma factor [Novosphingobium terrae]
MPGEMDTQQRQWLREQVLPLEPMLLSFAVRLCTGSHHDAEDLVHETFARLMAYEGWREIDNVAAFASRILKNLVIQEARRRKIMPIHMMADLEMLELADDDPGTHRVVEARDELATLVTLIDELPPQCGKVMKLCKIYGLSYAQIAVELGLSVSTVEKHVMKGLRICAERLAGTPGPAMDRGHSGTEQPDDRAAKSQRGGGRMGRSPFRLPWR